MTQVSTTATAAGIPDAPDTQAANSFFRDNLAAIKRWAPYLYNRLGAITAPHTELIVDPDGTIDIGFRGQRLYGQDAVAYANAQVEGFVQAPYRDYIREPDPANMAGMTGDFCAALHRRMGEAGIAYAPDQTFSDSHFLLIFGVGLGLHLRTMIERTNAKVAALIEPNLEYLYHSLFVTDWTELFEWGERRGVRFSLIVSQKPAEIAAKTSQVLRGNNPALIDGVTMFPGYPSVILDRAKDLIRQDLHLAIAGLGYFDDELVMCRNALGNLTAAGARILGDALAARDEPLFVIGSGPSVEADLDYIAKHAPKAMLMSIGTGLRGLLAHGVRPDFHLELENGFDTLEIIESTAAEFGLGGTTLVASATVHPGVARCFENVILYFRERVAPTEIFGGPFAVVQPSGPTVANSSLVASIRLGFREIYMFGVDMGSKADGRFHAKQSVYGIGQLLEIDEATLRYPGNFGGFATGTSLLDWSRKVLENTLHFYRTVRVYNCSDGVRIDGAVPKVARAINLPDREVDRTALAADIARGLVSCKPELWSQMWRDSGVRAHGEATLDRIDAALARMRAEADPDADWLEALCDIMQTMDQRSQVNATLLGGTLQLAVGCASWYERRLVDPGRRLAYRHIAAKELAALAGVLRDALYGLVEEMETALAATEAEDPAGSA